MAAMRVAIGADHAGVDLKRTLAGALAQQGHEILDVGTHTAEAVDYPDIATAVATALRNGQVDRGILVCGSGAGVAVAASKFPGIRASVCHDCYTARQAVEHDDLNVLCLGARVIGPALARALTDAFLGATFSAEDRHLRRLAKIDAIESRFAREP
ncbi:MAG: ribose 5-phosphate isomerase B [Vicinamibacterales bacterium]